MPKKGMVVHSVLFDKTKFSASHAKPMLLNTIINRLNQFILLNTNIGFVSYTLLSLNRRHSEQFISPTELLQLWENFYSHV